jgi:tetratricopeptide (TPR) repeat protein
MSVVSRWWLGGIMVWVLGLLSAACASDPPQFSEKRLSAIQWNHQARAAFNRGDYRQAHEGYHRALAMNRAIEDVDGIAIEVINLAAVHQQLGHRDQARKTLGEILASSGIPFTSTHKAEAAYRMAYTYLNVNENSQARSWLTRALEYCQSTGCAIAGKIHNLTARLLFISGENTPASMQARLGLTANQKSGNGLEQANSLRLLADIALAELNHSVAEDYYRQALLLDKRLDAENKIGLDLVGIGKSLVGQGRSREAQDYYQRARSVFGGLGHAAGAEENVKQTGATISR